MGKKKPPPDPSTLGGHIHAAMIARRMTQADLSRATGIPAGDIQKHRFGVTKPNGDNMLKYAAALHVSVESLYPERERPAMLRIAEAKARVVYAPARRATDEQTPQVVMRLLLGTHERLQFEEEEVVYLSDTWRAHPELTERDLELELLHLRARRVPSDANIDALAAAHRALRGDRR